MNIMNIHKHYWPFSRPSRSIPITPYSFISTSNTCFISFTSYIYTHNYVERLHFCLIPFTIHVFMPPFPVLPFLLELTT